MVTINDCTVRYFLTGVEFAHHECVHQFKAFVYSDYNKGQLPEMLIQTDGEFLWAYFTVPLSDIDKRLIRAFTMFDLSIEERLC